MSGHTSNEGEMTQLPQQPHAHSTPKRVKHQPGKDALISMSQHDPLPLGKQSRHSSSHRAEAQGHTARHKHLLSFSVLPGLLAQHMQVGAATLLDIAVSKCQPMTFHFP